MSGLAATAAPQRIRLPGAIRATAEFVRMLARKPVGLAGFIGVVFFLVLAFVVPFFVPLQNVVDLSAIYQRPSLAHPLGTDFQGRDVLNQIVHGGREILMVAIVAGLLSTLIAVTFGSLSATIGGRFDSLIMAITDIGLTIPPLPILVVIAALVRPTSVVALGIILALLEWPSLLRQVRAQVLSLKERDYVEAARSLDLGTAHIVFREILPNMRSYIVIHFIFAVTQSMYAQGTLILLGLVPLSGQNWAMMLYFADGQGAVYFRDSLFYILSPIMAIVLFQLSLVSLATALEDIFDPRLRSAA